MKKEGVTAGVPDILIMSRGTAYFLEMKKAKVKGQRSGSVSPEQRVMMGRLVAAGAVCAVAHGLVEAIAQLEAWGLLMTTTTTSQEMAA
jgi:hypothetical protein